MNELLNLLINQIKEYSSSYGNFEIYLSFDSVPVSSKSNKIFVVVSPERFVLDKPFMSNNGKIAQFTADFRISILSKLTTPNEKLLEFFYSVIVPAVHSGNCFLSEMQSEAPQIDLKLQKSVYSGLFRLKGLYIHEQEAES